MGVDRTVVMLAMVVAVAAPAAGDGATDPPGSGSSAISGATAPEVPCTPVATTWPTSSGSYELQPPRLAVVVTDLRPKDTVVLLDGRVTGRSRYFNGKKGFLYLEPGSYRLELRLDGYRPQAFTIPARPGCRFDIRHRMERARGFVDDVLIEPAGKGEPAQWIWEPIGVTPAPMEAGRSRGPDPSLRPDLGAAPPQASKREAALGSLRLRVKPTTASVSLDGSFLATARELDLMVAPVAISAGRHVIEARASGFASRSQEITVAPGELVELELVLQRGAP